MPGLGSTSLDPDTEYLVYEFWFAGRPFYVGHTWGHSRHVGRWGHVLNLVRHEAAGTLAIGKSKDLHTPSNQIIAALIKSGLPEHTVGVHWRGKGKANAEPIEKQRILELVGHGCVLANVRNNPTRASVQQVLQYLGVATV